MSREALSELVSHILTARVAVLVNPDTATSYRYNVMNPKTAALDISSEGLRKGSRQKTIDKAGTVIHEDTITYKQADLMTETMVRYFITKLPRFEYKKLAEVLVLAENNPMVTKTIDIFSAIYDDKTGRMMTTIVGSTSKGNARIIVSDKHGATIMASNFGALRTLVSDFAKQFGAFLNGEGRSFYGLTRSELVKASAEPKAKVSNETGQYILGDISDRLGESKIHIGHLGSLTDATRKPVQQASIDAALDELASDIDIQAIFVKGGLDKFIKRAKKINNRNFAKIHQPYWSVLTKNVHDLNNLKLIFDLETYGTHGGKTNSGILGKEETKYKNKFITANYVSKLISPSDFIHQETSPAWLVSVFKTIEHIFVSSIKAVRSKTIKITKKKTKAGKNSKTFAQGIVRSTGTIESDIKTKPITTKPVKAALPSFTITIPEEMEGKEDSCNISTRMILVIMGKLNYELHGAIKKSMGLPSLVYRTGRFAKSVSVDSIIKNSDCSLTAFYSYQTNPYAVFDPSISSYRGLSSAARNPQKIIGDSVRSIATSLMKDKYKIHPQWSGG